MGGGLPSVEQLGKKLGLGRDVMAFMKYSASAEYLGGNLLAEWTAPPEFPEIEFPEIKPATPPPTISETQEAGEEARKRRFRGRGRRGTFLTGDVTPDLTPTTGKKKLLGG